MQNKNLLLQFFRPLELFCQRCCNRVEVFREVKQEMERGDKLVCLLASFAARSNISLLAGTG